MPILTTLGAACARAWGFTSGLVKDQYFNLVSLLLPGNGTNGAQNNTFLDGSSNNFTITRNGNTTQGTFSPFSQTGWSGAFNTSTTYLTVTDTANLRFGSANFTIEAWVYRNASGATQTIASKGASTPTGWVFQISSADKLVFTDTSTSITGATSIAANTWTYVAVVRAGTGANQTTLYVNGTSDGTGTSATNFNQTSNMLIGADRSTTNFANGYISNLRLSNTNRTISSTPTTALTADANTIFLSLNLNRFQYTDSTAAYTNISATGTPSVVAFSPFAPTAAYTTAAVGGSGYFDGTGDYLTWSGSAIGTSQFSFECWFYATSGFGSIQVMFGPNSTSNGGISIRLASATSIRIDRLAVGDSQFTVPTMVTNQWYHLVACRDGSNNTTVFLNGTRSSTGTIADSYSYGNAASISYLNSSTPFPFTGYIAGARLVVGSTPYDPTQTSITVPTSPPTAITNTQLLLNFTNAGVVDATAKNVLETVGNAQISTTQSKWGGGSIYFDGTGDGLYRPNTDLLNLGTGNFTIEFWVNFASKTGYQTIASFGYTPLASTGWLIQTGNGDGKIVFYSTPSSTTTVIATETGATVNTGQWYHIAIVRNAGTTTIYRDGTSVGSGSDSTNYSSSTAVFYTGGGSTTGFNNFYLNGYIDDLRITRGLARYTSNFTAPTAPFPVQ